MNDGEIDPHAHFVISYMWESLKEQDSAVGSLRAYCHYVNFSYISLVKFILYYVSSRLLYVSTFSTRRR
jgi:hypothetical protein